MSEARSAMINSQLRPNRVNDDRIIGAIELLDREVFVPKEKRSIAYIDENIEVAPGRFLMEPRVLARLLVAADIQPEELVLDVACATGYSTAVLAGLADAVVAQESDPDLAQKAEENLSRAGIVNAAIIHGACDKGNAKQGPYDVIFIGGAVEVVPDCLVAQLKDGGRLLTVRMSDGIGRAIIVTKNDKKTEEKELFDANAMPLPEFKTEKTFVF